MVDFQLVFMDKVTNTNYSRWKCSLAHAVMFAAESCFQCSAVYSHPILFFGLVFCVQRFVFLDSMNHLMILCTAGNEIPHFFAQFHIEKYYV